MSDTVSHDPEATLGPDDLPRTSASQLPEPGDLLGRYRIRRRLGMGANGVVYEAHDPQLDRNVAVKLLRSEHGGGSEATAQHTALLEEARSLARLSHPNVVVVNDVGRRVDDGTVWVAMELVEGVPLDQWLAERERRWSELSRVLLETGEALAAAHAAGIVHRDFKPANVLVGDDGRPRVLDFGLARSIAAAPTVPEGDGVESSSRGRVEGTPAYMAPEQWHAHEVGPAADQFAYCVVVYEALTGARPFRGETLAELAAAVTAGEIDAAPTEATIPRHVLRAIRRGLAVDPEHRWPSMRALLDVLSRRRRRGVAVAGALALAAAGILWWVGAAGGGGDCRIDAAQLEGAWDDQRRAAVDESLRGVEVPEREQLAARTVTRLDEAASRWQRVWQSACEDGMDESDASARLDARMRCLSDARRSLATTVDALSEADTSTARRAGELVEQITDPRACLESNAAHSAPPPAIAARVEALEDRLARVVVDSRLGRYEQVDAAVTEMLGEVEALDWPRLEARVLLSRGITYMNLGRFDESAQALERAVLLAAEAQDAALEARAAIQLVSVVGYHLARPEEADRWSRHAEIALDRAGASPLNRAQLLNHQALIAERRGEHDTAIDLLEEALVVGAAVREETTLALAMSHANLGNALRLAGWSEEAKVHLLAALEIRREHLGDAHPSVGAAFVNLGNVHFERGEIADAERCYLDALAILTASLDEDHPRVAAVHNNLAAVVHGQGRPAEAAVHLREALRIRVDRLGEEHSETILTRLNLAQVQWALGNLGEMVALAEQARLDASGSHPELVQSASALIDDIDVPVRP